MISEKHINGHPVHCVNGTSIATDIILSVLPTPMLWNVKIEKRVKFVLICIISLGLFAAASCAIKIYYISLSVGPEGGDSMFEATYIHIWSSTECNLGIIAASILCLKPLFKTYFYKGRTLFRKKSARVYRSDRAGFQSFGHREQNCKHGGSLIFHTRVVDADEEEGTLKHFQRESSIDDDDSQLKPLPTAAQKCPKRVSTMVAAPMDVDFGDIRVLCAEAAKSVSIPVTHTSHAVVDLEKVDHEDHEKGTIRRGTTLIGTTLVGTGSATPSTRKGSSLNPSRNGHRVKTKTWLYGTGKRAERKRVLPSEDEEERDEFAVEVKGRE